ncbi:MAG: hypothetical protein ACFFCS_06240 [Candidatus Hodarchaeota archaeon]
MDLKLDFLEEAFIGQPLDVKVGITIDEKTVINYTAVKLEAIRPCERPLLIDQKEIFCKGNFEPGQYTRDISIPLANKIIPSSEQRGIRYDVSLYSRIPADGMDIEGQELFNAKAIKLVKALDKNKKLVVNPIILAIKGLKLELQKDIYRPGETIKINFEAKDMKELKIILMQRSNILCKCTQYGRVCTQVPVIPASAANAAKANNPTTGYLLLSVPKTAELSARHTWEPKEKSTWNDKFGDYNEWYLQITGKKYNNESINFEIPLEIDQGKIGQEKPDEIQFFESQSGTISPSSSGSPLFQPKKIKVTSVEASTDGFKINVKNDSSKDFNGSTCKITGIKDMFFETPPYMVGFGILEAGAEKEIQGPRLSKGITEVNLEFDSNQGKLGSFKQRV